MKKILVVDDDASIRKLIVVYLSREGYSVVEASNGQSGLDLMRLGGIDLVLLDLMMPVVSGWDVLRERSTDRSLVEIPVIIVSANRGAELADVMDRSICGFLPKPFDLTTLNALVRGCLESAAEKRSAVTAAMRHRSDARR